MIDYEKLLDDILMNVDYDIWKSYQLDLAEEPEFVEDDRQVLINIIKRHVEAGK